MLNLCDVLYAAFFSFILTYIIFRIAKLIEVIDSNSAEFNYNALDLNKIQNSCHRYFPEDRVCFGGETFKRGTFIKVQTYSEKNFEGLLIGASSEDVICILTLEYIVAYKLDGIRDIITLSDK